MLPVAGGSYLPALIAVLITLAGEADIEGPVAVVAAHLLEGPLVGGACIVQGIMLVALCKYTLAARHNIIGHVVKDPDSVGAADVGEDVAAGPGVVAEAVVESLSVDAVLPVSRSGYLEALIAVLVALAAEVDSDFPRAVIIVVGHLVEGPLVVG